MTAQTVSVPRGGVDLAQLRHRLTRLAVREFHAIRVIGAPRGRRRAEEHVVGRRLGRGHERLEHGLRRHLTSPFIRWLAVLYTHRPGESFSQRTFSRPWQR